MARGVQGKGFGNEGLQLKFSHCWLKPLPCTPLAAAAQHIIGDATLDECPGQCGRRLGFSRLFPQLRRRASIGSSTTAGANASNSNSAGAGTGAGAGASCCFLSLFKFLWVARTLVQILQ